MIYKELSPEESKIQVISDETSAPHGYLEGYASVFGNTDSVGDIVHKGAFKKTLRERLKKRMIKMFDSHQVRSGSEALIGVVTEAKEDDYGLWFHAIFSAAQRAQEVRLKLQEGILNAMSFGYDILKSKPNENDEDVLDLLELRLWEVSPVAWGANVRAMPEAVKAVISVTTGFGLAPVERAWSSSTAHKRFLAWAGDGKPVGEWGTGEWGRFRKGHLWVSEGGATKITSYKFLAVDVIDGSPKYVFRSAVAALGVVRGGRGGGPGADWWDSRKAIEAQVRKVYGKFDREVPPEKAVNAAVWAKLAEDSEALNEMSVRDEGDEVPETSLILDPDLAGQLSTLASEFEEAAASMKVRLMTAELKTMARLL